MVTASTVNRIFIPRTVSTSFADGIWHTFKNFIIDPAMGQTVTQQEYQARYPWTKRPSINN